jgi:hypothetical protein
MRRRPLTRRLFLLLLACGCLSTAGSLPADEIEILELSPSPPASLDGIPEPAPGTPITATAGSSVTVVVRYRLDGAAAMVEAFPRDVPGPAGAGFRLVPPTGPVPACGRITGPSEGRCAAAFALVCSDRTPATVTIEQVGATLGASADVVRATDFVTPARYTFRCPDPPGRPRTSCIVIGTADSPGETPLPFGRELPICRCLQDEGARELRCGILHPDFLAVRRVPLPVVAARPFTERWEFLALTPLEGPVVVTITGAGVADPVKLSFGTRGQGRPGKVESHVVKGIAPKEPATVPGTADFAYGMKDAESDLERAFRVDRTIEVTAGPPR